MKKLTGIIICLLLVFENISALAQGERISEKLYTLAFGEASPSGYSDYKWLDEEGNEVSFEKAAQTQKKTFSKRSVLPSSYNSADYGLVTGVKDQGISGNCWAFSFMSASESYLLTKSENLIEDYDKFDFSEAHHVWFTHESLVNDENDSTSGDGVSVSSPYQNGGNWLRSTFSLARGSGYAYEKDYPFYTNDLSSMGNYDESARYESNYRLADSYTIPSSDIQSIKEKIMANGSVTAAFYLSSSYLTRISGNTCYYCPDENATNHQIAIVGWDDNYSASNFTKNESPSSDGAWIVKNSYGASWGNDGFFYLSYCDRSLDNFNAVEVDDAQKYESVYQYDGYGYSTGMSATTSDGSPIKTVSFANVFTAKQKENLHSVAFYTLNPTVEYTIEIYTSLSENYQTPVSNGKCVLSQSGKLDYSGYFTVELDEAVSLEQGELFSVVITLTADEGALIPVEGQSGQSDGSFVRYYSSSLNQSYYKFGTYTSWQDSSSKGINNVCLKAFAATPDTYEIASVGELLEFADQVNSGTSFSGKTVRLTSDLDMSGVSFIPIGTEENQFDGVFDGNGKVIKNLSVSASDNAGFFGVTGENSTVKLLGLENVTVSANKNVGSLIGKANGKKIYNCYAYGSVSGVENVGGLVGYNGCESTDNSFALVDVQAQTMYGSFTGYNESLNTNCFTTDVLQPSGNMLEDGSLQIASADEFANGFVAYSLESASIVWTKGEIHPEFSTNENDAVYKASIYVVSLNDFSYIYLTRYEDVLLLFEKQYPGCECNIYTNYACTTPFTDSVTFDRMLFAKVEEIKLALNSESPYRIEDSILFGVEQGAFVIDIIRQFKNTNVSILSSDEQEVYNFDNVATGYYVCLKNSSGDIVDIVRIVILGDINSDGFVDSFDLSELCSIVNFETELEENSVFEKAADLNGDGFIDAFDLAIMTAVVNFEIEI